MDGESTELLRGRGFPLGDRATHYPTTERTLLRVLRDRSVALRGKPWLIFDSSEVLTYGEAWRLTNQVANAITSTVGEGAHVGLFMVNQPEFLPTFFGAMVNRGVQFMSTGYAGFVSTAHTEQDIDTCLQAFEGTLGDLKAAGVL